MVKNLWKGGRGARKDSRRNQSDAFPPVDANYETVGETLRKQREERGEDLRYVAQILRIRYPYLKAIEDGRPDELPGPTYAVGFVRTYADHLGLESEKLVHRFKEEAAGFQARADLHFPAPIPEGKIPSGAVLVVAVVLAAVVYSAWIYLSSREQQVAEIVPQLPNRISEIIKGKPGPAVPASTAAKPAEPARPAEAATATGAAPAKDKPADTPQAEKAKPDKSTIGPASDAGAGAASESRSGSVDGDVRARVATAAPAARSSESIPNPPDSNADSSEAEVTPAPSIVTAPQETPGSESGQSGAMSGAMTEGLTDAERAPPKIYGEENAGARIVIQAAADSWVEVRDSATDELLLTRVLFKGDRYRVPDRGGLTLLTGNAGGLRILVDGADAPPIGPLGAVRRNVVLEPAPLLAGNAARSTDNAPIRTENQTSEGGLRPQ